MAWRSSPPPVVWLHKLMSHRIRWRQRPSNFPPGEQSDEISSLNASLDSIVGVKGAALPPDEGGMKAGKKTADNETIILITNAPWLNNHLHL